jgi:acyl-coenzyme A synthetase/AMP-(fatty) acid ligase
MPAEAYPLVGRPLDALLFQGSRAGPVNAAAFLRAAFRIAATLPAGDGAALNLCTDRLGFALGFAACLLRGRPSVLASDRSAAGLAALRARFPGAVELHDGIGGVTEADRAGPAPANPLLPARQLAAIVLTSGSTGVPAAHLKAWGALAERSLAAADRFGWAQEAAPCCILATVPPQHMYGFETSVLLPLHAAAASWCGAALLPADVRAAMACLPGPAVLVTTPLHLRALLEAGGRLGSRHAWTISASAPLDPALAAAGEAQWEVPVLEIFGATEVGSVASRRVTGDAAWLAYPSIGLAAGPAGTIVTAPHAEATMLADHLDLMGEGRFTLLGRRADLIKLAGKRTCLTTLTRTLASLDGVEDAAFLVPDNVEERAASRLIAFAVAPSRRADDLLAELRGRMDPAFMPRRVMRVDRLPRNEVGKLPRQALVALHAQMTEMQPG